MQVNIISRGKGRSAVRAAAYRSGEKISCEYHEKTYFYPCKAASVIHAEIFLPANAPERLRDRATLWNEVEWIESRKDSQLAREIRIALQCEFSREQNIALAQRYCQALAARGMCADLCVHDKGDKNIHAHILLTTRPFNPDGTWGMKSHEEYVLDARGERIRLANGRYLSHKVCTTNWNEKETYLALRELYQDITNEYFARAGVDTRICVESYEQQGLDKEPTKYLGPYRCCLERIGIRTELGDLNREIMARNALREALSATFDKWVEQVKETLKQEAAREEAKLQEIFRQVAASEREKEEEKTRYHADLHRGEDAQPFFQPTHTAQLQQKTTEWEVTSQAAYRRAKRASIQPNGWRVKAKKDWPSVRARLKEPLASDLNRKKLEQEKQEQVAALQRREEPVPSELPTAKSAFRQRYDERNRGRREGKFTPERAFESWQAELLERSFQVEEEKGQPAYLNAKLVSKGSATWSQELVYHHERTRKDTDRSSHYAENVRIVRSIRAQYDERNQGLREGKYPPERAFEPWQVEVLERSFQVEEEKGQPAYIHTLLLSKETAPQWSQELEYQHERTRRSEAHSQHYAENVRMVREKRTRYDERNRALREGTWTPERAFEPWQAEVLARSFQVEEEKAQPAYLNAKLVSKGSATWSQELVYHHERTRKDTDRSSHYAETVRIVREKRTRYDERNQELRDGKSTPERAFEPWQAELLERSFQVEEEKGQPAYVNALLLSKGTRSRSPEVKHDPLQPERAAGDRPKIVPVEERRHHSHEREKEGPEHEMHVHLRAYLIMLRTARKALLRLQHRLTQIWKKQLAPLIKEVRKAQALQDSFNKLEKIRALQAILFVRIRQKVREAEEQQKAETKRESLMHHIPLSIQRAIRDLEPRGTNKHHSAVHLLETEQRPPPDEPITTHARPERSRLVEQGQAKGRSP